MFYRTIFVCLVGLFLAKSAEQDPLEITFEIENETKPNEKYIKMICDHTINDIQQNTYTVLEGEQHTIITKYDYYINYFKCRNYKNENDSYLVVDKACSKNVTTFKVKKSMGNLWNCTVLANRDNPKIIPMVQHKNVNYSAAYCYMKIHVRQTESPQTILVNNMVLQAVRTNLSEKYVDFIADYQYADGDEVNVTCVNFFNSARLTMEYAMAGSKSDNSTMEQLSSNKAIGFRVKLHSGHNNSYMICTNTESTDYSKVMLRFVMRTEFKNIVSIKINGMTLRPKLTNVQNHHYEIEYKYLINQVINVVCEVQKKYSKLVVSDKLYFGDEESSYEKREPIPDKRAEMSFKLNNTADTKKLTCSSDKRIKGSEEQVSINFIASKLSIDPYPLQMELPSNGTVMELYSEHKLKVIYYEFNDNEILQVKCGPLRHPITGAIAYIELKDSVSKTCNTIDCIVSKTLKLSGTRNTTILCYLKEQHPEDRGQVFKEIIVILRQRVPPATTSSTNTTPIKGHPADTNTSPTSKSSSTLPDSTEPVLGKVEMVAVICGAVLCIIIICVSTIIFKRGKRDHLQGGPHNRNYENLQSPSETSIPTYPPQWESNYAVPVDRRAEDTTYSVPCTEPALYSTPTPKNLRNKKQKPVDPTYAVLEVPNARGQKNIFKETDDPNYSEVYANRQEQCYAKVLPKSVRNKVAQDNNPYSYVTNEPAYANSAEPEPMYCEPAKAQSGTYANVNNAHYANSNAHEYVEPTYCEPPKRTK